MKIQILHSLHGDKEKDFDTSSEEGRAKVAKLFDELLRNGSAIFLERDDQQGKRQTYRVTGYQPETDRVIVQLSDAEPKPEDATPVRKKGGRGRKARANTDVSLPSASGQYVAAAPVSGGCCGN